MQFHVAFIGLTAFVVFSADAGPSMHNPTYCYATDNIRPQINMASVLTSYQAIRRFNFTTVNPYVSTCSPSRLWYLGMYGTRLPNPPTLQRIIDFTQSSVQNATIENYLAGRTTLCREDFENIRDFTMDSEFGDLFRIENAAMVTESGIFAVQNISRRFQQIFPNILSETYTPARFHFRHTSTPQSNDSIRAFATGLFGEAGAANVVYEPVPDADWFLSPFSFCPAFDEETADWERQRIAFREGPEIRELIEQVNRKLGFHTSNPMDFDQVWTMWNICVFAVATTFETSNSETGPDSPWCAPFSIAHHLLLEYYEDMRWFYSRGYGVRNQRLLQNMNCGLMQDLLRHMQSENDSDAMARIFMSSASEIQAMLVILGSFRDFWPMHQHNFAQQTTRNWLMSLITPYSGNLAAVRFDCDGGDHDVIFLLNERPILVPGCDQQNGVCKLSFIVNRFQRFIDANCSTLFCSDD
ncbi:multiple inositol polyphosphate phosphatase 1-like [Bradysia coprophila]|uniref:multiple inositol polyphosphate phosphatase 1-like n=1 Tax=Bradysia coprophila TaxID=38358 RepID=UPI00187DAB5D|nr:multiple inositol polyphosphate phosphatase 1-like [Bradysia coprophila]